MVDEEETARREGWLDEEGAAGREGRLMRKEQQDGKVGE